jgi:hypothetical protein
MESLLIDVARFFAIVAGGVLFLLYSRISGLIDKHPHWTILIITLLATTEYGILADASYIHFGDEGEITVPILYYLSHQPFSQVYSHEIAGGSDTYAMFGSGRQFFSLERLLLLILPVWQMVLIHKILICLVGIGATFLLLRKTVKLSPSLCIVLGTLFVYLDKLTLTRSIIHGPGRTIIPLVALMALGLSRNEKWAYWTSGVVVLWLSSISPTHYFAPMLVGTLAVAALIPDINWRRTIALLSAIVFAGLLNWSEVIYAMLAYAPFTARGYGGTDIDLMASLFRGLSFNLFSDYNINAVLLLPSVIWLILSRNQTMPRLLASLFIPIGAYLTVMLIPWREIGLGPVARVSWTFIFYSYQFLAVLVTAFTLKSIDGLKVWNKLSVSTCARLLAAFALVLLINQKGRTLFELIHNSGQASYHSISNLSERSDWEPNQLYRVATLNYHFPSQAQVPSFYSLDSIDSYINLSPRRLTDFIAHGIENYPLSEPSIFPVIGARWQDFHLENPPGYEFDPSLSLGLMGVANVRYFITTRPIRSHPTLRLVSGPEKMNTYEFLQQSTAEKISYYKTRLEKITNFGPVYIYELPTWSNRVFGVKKVEFSKGKDKIDFYDDVEQSVSRHIALIAPGDEAIKPEFDLKTFNPGRAARVDSISKIPNGYSIELKDEEGGLLALNATYLPFWTAHTDSGVKLDIIPVNGIHMLVNVPKESRSVIFRYDRKRLADKLLNFLNFE